MGEPFLDGTTTFLRTWRIALHYFRKTELHQQRSGVGRAERTEAGRDSARAFHVTGQHLTFFSDHFSEGVYALKKI